MESETVDHADKHIKQITQINIEMQNKMHDHTSLNDFCVVCGANY